jgi:hypothetical protein
MLSVLSEKVSPSDWLLQCWKDRLAGPRRRGRRLFHFPRRARLNWSLSRCSTGPLRFHRSLGCSDYTLSTAQPAQRRYKNSSSSGKFRSTGLNSMGNEPALEGKAQAQKSSPDPPGNTGLVQIVRRHFHLYAIAGSQADPTFPHLTGNCGEHHMPVRQLHSKHCAWQDYGDCALYFNMLFFCLYHSLLFISA